MRENFILVRSRNSLYKYTICKHICPNDDLSFSVNIAEVMDSEEYDIEDDANDFDASVQINAVETETESDDEDNGNAIAANEALVFSDIPTTDEDIYEVRFVFSFTSCTTNKLSHMVKLR